MGYIPIFVALLGFVLLYTIYTYNLIKPRKAKLTQAIDRMAENSKNRKSIILEHDQADAESALADVATMLKKASTNRFQSYRKEEEYIQAINTALESISDNDIVGQLKASNAEQESLIKNLQSISQEYNTFIGKAPVSIVASLFGFRQF